MEAHQAIADAVDHLSYQTLSDQVPGIRVPGAIVVINMSDSPTANAAADDASSTRDVSRLPGHTPSAPHLLKQVPLPARFACSRHQSTNIASMVEAIPGGGCLPDWTSRGLSAVAGAVSIPKERRATPARPRRLSVQNVTARPSHCGVTYAVESNRAPYRDNQKGPARLLTHICGGPFAHELPVVRGRAIGLFDKLSGHGWVRPAGVTNDDSLRSIGRRLRHSPRSEDHDELSTAGSPGGELTAAVRLTRGQWRRNAPAVAQNTTEVG